MPEEKEKKKKKEPNVTHFTSSPRAGSAFSPLWGPLHRRFPGKWMSCWRLFVLPSLPNRRALLTFALTSAWFPARAAANAFHYNGVFYFLQLRLYVILKGDGHLSCLCPPSASLSWRSIAISHFYGLTFKRHFVTLSLGFKDTQLILTAIFKW